MIHETIVDYYVRNVDCFVYMGVSRVYCALRSVGYLPYCSRKHFEK